MTAQTQLASKYDPVFDTQRGFSALMDAMARPGSVHPLPGVASPPTPMNMATGLIALTLCDGDTPVWFDDRLKASAEMMEWMAFHTGAPVTEDAGEAAFIFIGHPEALSILHSAAIGTQEYPDRSATAIVQVEGFSDTPRWRLEGPGIQQTAGLEPLGIDASFPDFWAENRAKFPLGIDMIFAAPDAVAALPRTAHITENGA